MEVTVCGVQVSPEEMQAMREQMEQEMQQEAVEQGELLHAETIARVSLNLPCC